jgi:nifR3 family TIM-barrel protein
MSVRSTIERDAPHSAERMLSIGSVRLATPLILAPMAGITDRQFRLILRRLGGVGLVTMEFVSSLALVRGDRRTRSMIRYAEEERPISIQIYGSAPGPMAAAARVVQDIGADVCDINMGCPANKVLKGCAGCGLMGDLDLARRIIADLRAAIAITLTVKFRSGLRDDAVNYLELGRICEGEGVDAVTLHPRTAKQMFRGEADWRQIAELKSRLSIPVIGNGDVASAEDVVRMVRDTACDGVMIGRASMKNPWIYRQAEALMQGRDPVQPTLEERRDLILRHFDLLIRQEEPRVVLHKLRTFTGWYTHGLPQGRNLRVRIGELDHPTRFVEAIEGFFETLATAA